MPRYGRNVRSTFEGVEPARPALYQHITTATAAVSSAVGATCTSRAKDFPWSIRYVSRSEVVEEVVGRRAGSTCSMC